MRLGRGEPDLVLVQRLGSSPQRIAAVLADRALFEQRGPLRLETRVREAQGFRYSYDMLGEAALTADDAARYLASYEAAIQASTAVVPASTRSA